MPQPFNISPEQPETAAAKQILASAIAALNLALKDLKGVEEADRFAGAVVLCPPGSSAVSFVIVASEPDPVHFWAMVKGKADSAIATLDQQRRTGAAGGAFRRG